MKTVIIISKLAAVSLTLSLSTIIVGGFPALYYLPAGDDYAASFYEQEFLVNTVIIFVLVTVAYFVFKKLKAS